MREATPPQWAQRIAGKGGRLTTVAAVVMALGIGVIGVAAAPFALAGVALAADRLRDSSFGPFSGRPQLSAFALTLAATGATAAAMYAIRARRNRRS